MWSLKSGLFSNARGSLKPEEFRDLPSLFVLLQTPKENNL